MYGLAILDVTYREIWIKSIRSDFSTLLILDAGRLAILTGVHCLRTVTTNCTVEGRDFINDPQLLSIAERMSAFLTDGRLSRRL
jgi:hypothetical protein